MYSDRDIMEKMAARAVGQIPISIPTSLALEGAFGIHPDRERPPYPPINDYSQIWINVRTMVRNLLGSVEKGLYEYWDPRWVGIVLPEEMRQIETAVISQTNGKCGVVFYNLAYERLAKVLPNYTPRPAHTEKQLYHERVESESARVALSLAEGVDIRNLDQAFIEAPREKVALVTHIATDLLSRYNFEVLDLLESHTGAIKKPALWYTKLTNGRNLPPMPFNKFTVRVFGDNGNLVASQDIKLRRAVIRLAEEFSWTPITTMDKIRQNVSTIEDREMRAAIIKLL